MTDLQLQLSPIVMLCRGHLTQVCVNCHNSWHSGPWNAQKIGLGTDAPKRQALIVITLFTFERLDKITLWLEAEFSHANLTQPIAWFIPFLLLPLGGTLLRHKVAVCWMVVGLLIFKWMFLLFFPIILSYTYICCYKNTHFDIYWRILWVFWTFKIICQKSLCFNN